MKKEIIALIEPYMDKTLSLGCLVGGGNLSGHTGEFTILGHYDMTAVLKYISINMTSDFSLHYNGDEHYVCDYRENEDFYYKFPNKPLHLYMEQEEKDLLKLLKKLCINKKG